MPWTERQKRTARAVAHGWKPKGKAKGFGRNLADLILSESRSGHYRKKKRKKEH
jgi:hypothetical protein